MLAGLYYPCSENKGVDQLCCTVTAQLICAYVFVYADCCFSDAAADFSCRVLVGHEYSYIVNFVTVVENKE